MRHAVHALGRLTVITLSALAVMLGLAFLTSGEASAAECDTDAQCAALDPTGYGADKSSANYTPAAPVIIEPGIPHDHECVLQTRTKAYRVVADTDPRCLAWWGPNRNGPVPTVAPFDPNVKPAAKHAPKRVKHHAPKRAQKVRTIVVVPDLSTIQTTPVICRMGQGPADGRFRWEACTPEESPEGGHLVAGPDEDGSAAYSDGWTIAPKRAVKPGTTGAVLGKWKAPAVSAAVKLAAHVEQGPGIKWIPTEDRSRVASSFYDRKTTTGATQARCDYLGKQRVTDPTYGHRCV